MADYISGSAGKYIVNAQMVGGVTLDVNGKFTGLPGGQSGSVGQSQLNPAIHNNSLISALNTIYDSASGNEPAGAASNIQYNLDGESFGASNNLVYNTTEGLYIGNDGGISVSGSISGTLGSGKTFSLNDGSANSVFKVTAAGLVTADGSITGDSFATDGDEFTVSTAGAIEATSLTSTGTVSGSAMTGLAGTLSSLNVQSGGITNAGAIAGATTVSGSGLATFGGGMTATGVVSGSGAGSLGSLTLDGALALQSAGITAAGAIAGATSIDASGDLTVGTITNAEFTVDANGNTDIDGTLNVEGVPTFQAGAVFSGGVTTANAIAGATTIDASDLASLDGGIDVASKFTVSTGGAVVAVGVNAGGAISGATTIASTEGATLDTSAAGSSFGGELEAATLTDGTMSITAGAVAAATTIGSSGAATLDTGANGSSFGGNLKLGTSVADSLPAFFAQEVTGMTLTGSALRSITLQDPLGAVTNGLEIGAYKVSGTFNIGSPDWSTSRVAYVNPGCFVNLQGVTGSLTSSTSQKWNDQKGNWQVGQGCTKFYGNVNGTPSSDGYLHQIGPAFKLSSSNSAAAMEFMVAKGLFESLPYFTMQGTDDTGKVKDYKLQVSGGVLKVSDYGVYG
jgi:hypothetical protein